MDETGVMLSMLASAKVLVSKDDTRDYRGARIKRTTVTAICWIPDHVWLPMVAYQAGSYSRCAYKMTQSPRYNNPSLPPHSNSIECISADGRYLHPTIIWPATTHRSKWTTYPTPGWHYACTESGFTDSQISFKWLTSVFDPQTKGIANDKPRVLICDGFSTHETLEILEYCFANSIILCRLPHTSHKLQPCDVAVFAPLKAAYRVEARN